MSTGTIAFKFKSKNPNELHGYGVGLNAGFVSNSGTFTQPQPALSTLTSALSLLLSAISSWGPKGDRGTHSDWLNLQDQVKNVRAVIKALGNYAQSITTDGAILSSVGFELQGAKSPSVLLPQVHGLEQVFGRNIPRNFIKLDWKRPLNTKRGDVKIYLVYRGTTANLADALYIDSVTKTAYVDENPGTGLNYYFIIPANTVGAGEKAVVIASTSAF